MHTLTPVISSVQPCTKRRNCLGASTCERGKNRVRLPKLEMKKFGGDPVVWPEFYKTFKVSVHENGGLLDVEKFSYLKHYVFGEAASSARACKSKSKCSFCNGNRHHSALFNSTGAPPVQKVTEPEVTNDGGVTTDATTASCTSETVPSASVSMSATNVNRNPVFLQTIRVAVSSGTGTLCGEANILFDLGSQKTYIQEKPCLSVEFEAC